MTIVGFEIVNMEEGDIQAVKCKSLKGGLTIQNAVRTSFNKPLFKVGQKEICGFLKQNGMSHKNILLILPSNVYKSQIWAAESDDKPSARDIIEKNASIYPR